MALTLVNKPTVIEHGNCRFLIMDAPTDANLPVYINELNKYHTTALVRACEPTYNTSPLKEAKIDVVELPFPDGDPPPNAIVDRWLQLVDSTFGRKPTNEHIAVHCIAGLGRAPVLVAIALMEQGMEPLAAIKYIRERRRGAINARQIKFLEHYQRRSKFHCPCIIC